MIPGTFFEWVDQSDIVNPEISTVRTMPLFASVITSDKGKEDWTRLYGQDWFDMYAVDDSVDFTRHGQPLLQTAMAINAGAELLTKRVVADDATLANLGVVVTPKTTESQKQDADGNPLYTDASTGEETTTAEGNTPIMVSTTTLTYTLKSAANCKTKEEVIEAIMQAVDTDNESAGDTPGYLLWVLMDNGRGTSRKRIRIVPNYNLSKNYESYFLYDLEVYESNKQFSTLHFCLSPDIISNNENISLQYVVNTDSTQLTAAQFNDNIRSFMDVMAAAIGTDTVMDPNGMDMLYGANKRGIAFENIKVDTEAGVDLQILSGTVLLNGTDGAFGDTPIEAADYGNMLAKAFAGYIPGARADQFTILTEKDGCYDPIIYNVDRYRIDAVFDANYPAVVKRAIEQLVTYREDCFYFRDMGTKCNTLDLIMNADMENLHTKFAGTYCTYYDVINPYSRKQITVTMMYSMVQLVVTQFNNGRNLPMAGIKYGFTITDAIEGTVAFTPTICPGLNQKEDLVDAHINYATYIDNSLVIETLYTSQDKYTQLSFINNVLAVQEVIKEIRRRCPAIRYSFIDGDDLEKYRAEVEEIIAPYTSNFKSLTITYMQDAFYTRNKIFYATLAVQFRDFVQTEYFKIVALSSDVDATLSSGTV